MRHGPSIGRPYASFYLLLALYAFNRVFIVTKGALYFKIWGVASSRRGRPMLYRRQLTVFVVPTSHKLVVTLSQKTVIINVFLYPVLLQEIYHYVVVILIIILNNERVLQQYVRRQPVLRVFLQHSFYEAFELRRDTI